MTLCPCRRAKPSLTKYINSPVHRLPNLGAEAAGAERGLIGQKLMVDPGRTRRRDLRLDREVRSGGERQALAVAGIVIGTRFHDGAGPRVARHLQVGEDEMLCPPVDAFDDGVGRALQLVMQAALDQSAQDWLGRLVAVKREARDVGFMIGPAHRPVHDLDDVAADAEVPQRWLDARLQRPLRRAERLAEAGVTRGTRLVRPGAGRLCHRLRPPCRAMSGRGLSSDRRQPPYPGCT